MKDANSRLLLMLVLGGFALMLVDVRHMHRDVLSDEWQTWIPIFVSIIGMIVTAAVLFSLKLRPAAYFVYIVGAISGIYGSYLHSDGDVGRVTDLFASREIVAYAKDGDEAYESRNQESEGVEPPLLAPLGLAGLCAFGIVGVMGLSQQKEEK